MERLEFLFEAKKNTKEGDELEVLGIWIDQYEQEHFTFGFPDPIAATKKTSFKVVGNAKITL